MKAGRIGFAAVTGAGIPVASRLYDLFLRAWWTDRSSEA
jgi:hypothetical protein